MTQAALDVTPTRTLLDRLAHHFRRHAGQWIDAHELARIGGTFAFRTRVSECRTQLGMVIENRQRRVTRPDGSKFTISEYRYQP